MIKRLFSLSLTSKLALSIAFVSLIPMVVMAILSYISASRLNLQNLEAFIAESGARRQQAVENDFRGAFNALNVFLDSTFTQRTISDPLLARLTGGTPLPENRNLDNTVERLFERNVVSSSYFSSAWLLTTQGISFAEISERDADDLTGLTERSRAEIIRIGQRLQLRGNDRQALAFVTYNEQPAVLVVNLLYGTFEGESVPIGYLVIELDLNTIILENLEFDLGEVQTYSYVMLPRTADTIASSLASEQGLVDTTSVGAQRILRGEASSADRYFVGTEENRREVLGYYAAVEVEEERFAIITEVDITFGQQQIAEYVAGISFPIILGTPLLLGLGILLITQMVLPPINQLREAIRGVTRGSFEVPVPSASRTDEIGALSVSFVDMREYIQRLMDDMNRRLLDRTRDVRLTQDISRAVTAERDLNRLLSRVVQLIVDNFPSIYHAQIFLLDQSGQYALLRASTGEAGLQLLQRGHRLAVGSVSVIGQVTEQGQVVIARDTAESDVHRRNEFLTETRAELAIPLRLGDRIIGALDVQSKQRDSFDPNQVNALQMLADQITIAIENARLYAESERLLVDIDRERRETGRRAWTQYVRGVRTPVLTRQAGAETGYDFSALSRAVYEQGKSVIGDPTERNTIPFAVPIKLRGETLGIIEYELPRTDFNYDKVLLAEELVARLAISLENARLFQESQQSAERERIVNEISARITGQASIEDIFETAIREVGSALRTPQVAIRLNRNGASANGVTAHENGNGNAPLSTIEPPHAE